MDHTESLQNRVTEFEIRSMQLQQELDALNAVVLTQQKELGVWRAALARFETRLESMTDPEPPRDPLVERPPHY